MAKKKPEAEQKPAIVTETSLAFFEKYINNPSPTGFEYKGQELWLEYLKPYIDDHFVDNYGTAVGVINPQAEYKVVIEAHADEISWFVNYITNDGLIYVIRNGGSDHQIAPSKRVNIHTDNGIVKAVFGWPAIHTRLGGEKEEAPTLKNIFLDCGCVTKDEVEALGIHVGCVITYEDEFMVLNNRYYVGRALDNRAGGFMIAEVARLLKENNVTLPFGLYIVNAVQEEIGLRGAEMIAHRIKPNVAIVTDVTHDTGTPMINKITQGDLACGKGPVISYAPAVQNNLNKLLIESAQKAGIPFQRQASSRSTGTDTDAFAYSNDGVPSALISLPLRYMHTTVEMIHKEDVDNVIRLIYESLLNIQNGQDFRYIK
ncbi:MULTISPECIES: M42 family metallopeptidase [unclassified Mucilaginibacter]|uniref:M42 family metallopeptidase n=1 Tax=unclassified Mucilaginibacter TaxID=2617802 RepID=UPI002AC95EDE|nr:MULTISPECIES: M42 family metallopeptidase [unclassified Mucilaginibacter]MEB0249801.1 M42 family metallopeptidase [Mucilaginibacter sp. 5B2]MEB0263733.1 M42 family metallopeptidase [Mucilaginibacter sp. 10I4]MEB0278009.1 M42 family metallopeptidase [Mucilaginibacter sp. 10B2]MEB0299638.1 M42 family metallopeptidase [Mucilaginibacter sp. 5C4]WPX22898.1 M42 family metallopeptidase [Mucilaginibacter sp. 5C4]